ncbi:MAG TPA: hypothetical protein VMM38_12215 [Aridibacter sp.]|nr:hypothetical protein [Aridibacter sp.]
MFVLLGVGSPVIYGQQVTTDFSGKWKLDTSETELDTDHGIESITLKIEQSESELIIEKKISWASEKDRESALKLNRLIPNVHTEGILHLTLDWKRRFSRHSSGASVLHRAKIDDSARLIILEKLVRDQTLSPVLSALRSREATEIWTLSSDKKRITVERRPKLNSSKTLSVMYYDRL